MWGGYRDREKEKKTGKEEWKHEGIKTLSIMSVIAGKTQSEWTVRGSNLGRDNIFFSSLKRPDRLWVPLSLIFNGYWGFLLGGKAAGAWRLPPSSI
jgi:hypothetical protein